MYTHDNSIKAVSSLLNTDKEAPVIIVNEGNIRHLLGLLGLYIDPTLEFTSVVSNDVAKAIADDAKENHVELKNFINDVHDNMKYLKSYSDTIDVIIYETLIKTISVEVARELNIVTSIAKCVGWHKRIISIVKAGTAAMDITADEVINS